MSERVDFLTPVGRLVSGDCFKANTTDQNGNPLLIKSGPNAGQPTQNYNFGVAFDKNDVGYPELWGKIHAEAKRGFPQYFDAANNCILPTFAFKITDGDSAIPNTKGNKPCDRTGYPGHWVIFFSGSFAPKCFTAGGQAIITDPTAIKRGYFVRVSGSVVSNDNEQKPGVYMNYSMVELIGYGEEIQSGPDGAAVFGGSPVTTLPPGASATPLAPSTTPANSNASAPVNTAPAPVNTAPAPVNTAPAPVNTAPAPSGPGNTAPAPAQDYLNNTAPAPVVVEASHIVNGVAYTVTQLKASGHTDVMIATYPLAP